MSESDQPNGVNRPPATPKFDIRDTAQDTGATAANFSSYIVNPDAHAPIRIRGLRLRGVRRDYIVDFTEDDGTVRQLSVIAGEISTGKTTILEFVDYCLGADHHPQHDEVISSVRAVQLAIEVVERVTAPPPNAADGEFQDDVPDPELEDGAAHLVRYVIERPVGGATRTVMLFRGDHNGLADSPPRRLTLDPKDPESLSQFLLGICGLAGLRTRETPAQEESRTSILSFRDVMPLALLTNRRLDNADLVLEKNPARTLKLRQVVDFLFKVSDAEASALAQQIESLRNDLRSAIAGLKSLRTFLADAGVADEETIENQITVARAARRQLTESLSEIDRQLAASTQFAQGTRNSYYEAAQLARTLDSQIRERETLVTRLLPLGSQYADDIRKLDLLAESQRLFDALSVTVCPACQSALSEPVDLVDGHCTLCRTPVPHLRHRHLIDSTDNTTVTDAAAALDTDLSSERRSVKRRLNELMNFIDDVRRELTELGPQLAAAQTQLIQSQQDFDATTSDVIAPFVTQRDQLIGRIADLSGALATMNSHRSMHAQIIERERTQARTSAALALAKERQRTLEQSRQTRDEVLDRLARRFESTLRDFGLPKLSDVRLQRTLIPIVRGNRYDLIGSSGAMTLIALAWELAVFEVAVESGEGHPGFLLIDSPQKNLRPGTRSNTSTSPAPDTDDDRTIAAQAGPIVDRIYAHILSWLTVNGDRGQIIVVDNEPPTVAADAVVVRYSGRTNDPPYGLIEDATD